MEVEIAKISGKDNVEEGEVSIAMFTKLRMLFSLHGSSSASKQRRAHQLSPAQAPKGEVVENLSPFPSLHELHIYHIAPSPNRRHPPLVHETEEHLSAWRKHSQMIIAISASVLATLAIFVVMAVLVLVYRRRRRKDGHCNTSNKVSFDPEPDMFYFDSLAPFLESDSDHKLSTELKSALAVENNINSSLQTEGMTLTYHSFLDSEKHSVEAGNLFENSSSDGSESFHSICCSHCSIESKSTYDDPNLDLSIENGHLSPLTSLELNVFSTRSIKQSTKSTNFTPNTRKSPLPPLVLESLAGKSSQLSNTLNDQDNKEPHPSSESSNLKMESAARLPSSKDTESSNLTAKIPYESRNKAKRTDLASSMPITVDIVNSAKQLQTLQSIKEQQIPNSSNCNGSIPKPPPPPPPPPFQKSGSFGKPVPPPPFQPQQSLAVDKDGNPLPKLKPLHWDKVRAVPDRSMVWDKIRSSSFV